MLSPPLNLPPKLLKVHQTPQKTTIARSSSRCPSARATVRKEYRSSVLESLARRLLKGPVVRCQYKKPSVAGTNCLLKGRLAQVEKENTGATKSIPISDGRVPLGPHTPSRTSTTEGQKKVNTTGKTKDTKIIIDLSNDTESSTELEEDIQLSIGDRRSLEIKLLKGFQLEEFETHDETKGSCPEKSATDSRQNRTRRTGRELR